MPIENASSFVAADIESITLEETKQFFYEYYRPKNAILTVAGNVKTSEIEQLAKKWFGNIELKIVHLRHNNHGGVAQVVRAQDS